MNRVSVSLVLVALVALSCTVPYAEASANGLKYICDTTRLASDNLCYFVADPSYTPAFTASGHNIDRSVGEDGYRMVANAAGSQLPVSPKPWDQGDVLAKTTTKQEGDALNYVLAFELIAPLRDAVMYKPETLSTNEARWNELTKALVDCKVKETSSINGPQAALSVKDTYTVLKAANTQTVYSVPPTSDAHHSLLQFLEESAIDLVCVMTDLTMDRCDTMRAHLGLKAGEKSECWKDAYNALYSSGSNGGSGTGGSSTGSASKAVATAISSVFMIAAFALFMMA